MIYTIKRRLNNSGRGPNDIGTVPNAAVLTYLELLGAPVERGKYHLKGLGTLGISFAKRGKDMVTNLFFRDSRPGPWLFEVKRDVSGNPTFVEVGQLGPAVIEVVPPRTPPVKERDWTNEIGSSFEDLINSILNPSGAAQDDEEDENQENDGINAGVLRFPIPELYDALTAIAEYFDDGVLRVKFKNGKTDHWENERRKAMRTFGIVAKEFVHTPVDKAIQRKAEIGKRRLINEHFRGRATFFGENIAIQTDSFESARQTIKEYFSVALECQTRAIRDITSAFVQVPNASEARTDSEAAHAA